MSLLDEPVPEDDLLRDRTRVFEEFLDSDSDIYNYKDDIARMLRLEQSRLVINIDDLRDYKREFADGLLKQPVDFLPAAEDALLNVVQRVHDREKHDIEGKAYHIGFSGSFGDHHVSPRTLRAAQLGKMISLEGIVTRCSLVRPKMLKSVHYCAETQLFHAREYRDATTSTSNLPPTSSITPQTDDQGNSLTTEFGFCVFRDHQRISIQEMPERAPAGQLPRSTDVIMDDDLVDKCKPGDRIQLVGVYRSIGGGAGGAFKSLILANNINLLSSKIGAGIAQTPLTDSDIRMINQLAKRDDIFALLSQSLAPSIFGHEYIKKAVVLMLLGGAEKNLPNGTHIRGDINVLMVGDPSTAKSQILRFVLGTAPLAIATTGRGSSGVGLTAAVTTDRGNGGTTAGGCVIAAANPIYGQYDIHKDPHKNIALPDSLLSRFDLLFIVTDDVNEERDRKIAEHVLRMHRYLPPGVEEGTPVSDSLTQHLSIDGPSNSQQADVEEGDASPFQKYDPLIHFGINAGPAPVGRRKTRSSTRKAEVLAISFVKKYIQYAKSKPPPVLTKGAADHIIQVYATLRNENPDNNQKRTSPLTARTLETLIRLATAHAKATLSPKVEFVHAQEAEAILRFALYKEVVRRPRKKRHTPKGAAGGDADAEGDEDDEDEEEEEEEEQGPERMQNPQPAAAEKEKEKEKDVPDLEAADANWGDGNGNQDVEMGDGEDPAAGAGINKERVALFRRRLARLYEGELRDEEQFYMNDLVKLINNGLTTDELFGTAEATAICTSMTEENELMISDGIVYKI
ncbi:hypothetical protein EUX98_g4455 [Antrodiella citrinella]|uniref:DNA replication licensing factor MCM3 n=1 Tax=Antrodiella citrinella TaxID=2447956 RepID=A0A4S4MU23_9APHY|nr:hypothetical protein EUX98_g4455 [Antrodiella citrinella]